MEDILKVWTAQEGGRYERIAGRPGERDEEYLIGEQELPYTQELLYQNIPHYVISFNQRVERPLSGLISSGNTERLNDDEIRALINNPPEEEL
jgi:hypothetical protein